jgi:hypothetical protein
MFASLRPCVLIGLSHFSNRKTGNHPRIREGMLFLKMLRETLAEI